MRHSDDAKAPLTTIAPPARPFVAAGAVSIIAGGIAAAVTGPTGWDDGSWVAAFLVLVTGVGQTGLGVGQAALTGNAITGGRIAIELTLIDVGALLVVAGTLGSVPLVVTIGGLVLAAGLGIFAMTARGTRRVQAWLRRTYLALLVVLLVSIPIGLALAWGRA